MAGLNWAEELKQKKLAEQAGSDYQKWKREHETGQKSSWDWNKAGEYEARYLGENQSSGGGGSSSSGSYPQLPKANVPGLTSYQQQGLGILSELLKRELPEIFGAGQEQVAGTLRGDYDPRTSDYYKGMREQMLQEEQQGLSQLRRGANLGGMLYSEPRMRHEGDYLSGQAAQRQSLLGSMFENERSRQQQAANQALQYAQYPDLRDVGKIQAAMTYGEAPRSAEMDKLLFPYQYQVPLLQQIYDSYRYYMPQQYPTYG
jgi:hypothetical protein